MIRVLMCVAMVVLLAGQAYADIDLRINDGGSSPVDYYGVTFTVSVEQSTGTGVFDPFVRIQGNGTEAGFNTDVDKPPLETKAGLWTHSITLGEIPIVDGRYEFRLDINQASSNPFLSLDTLQIYLGGSGSPATLAEVQGVGYTKVYDLDAYEDTRVLLDYNINSGSGSGDMVALIPIVGSPGQYLTLYSVFGASSTDFEGNDGFEEWGVLADTVPVPVPGAVVLGLLGMSAAGWRLRRFA